MKFTGLKRGWLSGAAAVAVLAAGLATTQYGASSIWAESPAKPIVYQTKSAPPVSSEEADRAVASAKDLSTAFRVASERVLPSLVTIETRGKASADESANRSRSPRSRRSNPFGGGRNPLEGTPFEDMFPDGGNGFHFEMPDTPPHQQQGMGSGVVIDKSGLILTNNHVVAGGKNVDVLVRLSDGREFKAADVWTDPKTDIAIVKIADADDLTAAVLADSDEVSVGDWVLALGQPFGLESTVTAGIISAKQRGIGINMRENYLQTDAAINPGNSGGPLVNLDGQVIGINTAISSRGGGNDGVGFAIPVNVAKWVADQLADGGTVKRAYLGVSIKNVNAEDARKLKVKPREGVQVGEVFADTPAAKAGLQVGDVIVNFAGVSVHSPNELQLIVEQSQVGKPHQLAIIREGEPMMLTFVPEEQPTDFDQQVARSRGPGGAESSDVLGSVGIEISALTDEVAQQLGLKDVKGVLITSVERGSAADEAGLEAGMVITQINRKSVADIGDVKNLMKDRDADQALLLLVRTEDGSRFVAINP
ncbi:MAG: trypsin-like peptidase domain-containing protein [Planctomycetales bacterium]|nr:trypsin-like peptidase domain-containing protein [Planctomycetales bacterium]